MTQPVHWCVGQETRATWIAPWLQLRFHGSFSLHKSNISKITTKYDCEMQVFPFKGVTCTSCNSCKISPSHFYGNYVCISAFTLICCQVWLLYFLFLIACLKIFHYLLCPRKMLDLHLNWSELITWPHTSRPPKRKCKKSVSIPLLRYISVWIRLKKITSWEPVCIYIFLGNIWYFLILNIFQYSITSL